MSVLGKQLKYINEGNIHIVLQVVDTKNVIRLIKEDSKPLELKEVYNSISFVNNITLPLIYKERRVGEEIIEIPTEELEQLTKDIHELRPNNRRFKTILSPYAIIAPNLAMLSEKCEVNYCIEIKPKEGFISTTFKNYGKCYYCLKQFLKLQNKQIENVSKYCPLDLFSGVDARMKYALMNLVDNPQNNFKMFKDGRLVYHEKSCRKEFDDIVRNMHVFNDSSLFLDFLIKILLSDNNSNIILKEVIVMDSRIGKDTLCINNNNLKSKSFLYNILYLQKLSEKLDFESAALNVENIDYVSNMLDRVKNQNLNLALENERDIYFKMADPMHLALISTVVKDCSIMISFSPNFAEGYPYIQLNDRKIPYKVAATDLEPKPVKTLAKRRNNERKLIDIYEKYLETTKIDKCKIQLHTETRAKQVEAWQHLIVDYLKATKQSTIDIRESQNNPLFNNASIKRKLSQEAVLTILEDMARSGKAAPIDKSKNIWEIYWHSLDEWGNMIYSWANCNGLTNSVCTMFELREGENTVDEEFHGLDMNVLLKALRALEAKGKCEIMEFDDNQGVKFF